MLHSAAGAYGVALETDLACFPHNDVLWFNPAPRPCYGGPGVLDEAEWTPGEGMQVRLDFARS